MLSKDKAQTYDATLHANVTIWVAEAYNIALYATVCATCCTNVCSYDSKPKTNMASVAMKQKPAAIIS